MLTDNNNSEVITHFNNNYNNIGYLMYDKSSTLFDLLGLSSSSPELLLGLCLSACLLNIFNKKLAYTAVPAVTSVPEIITTPKRISNSEATKVAEETNHSAIESTNKKIKHADSPKIDDAKPTTATAAITPEPTQIDQKKYTKQSRTKKLFSSPFFTYLKLTSGYYKEMEERHFYRLYEAGYRDFRNMHMSNNVKESLKDKIATGQNQDVLFGDKKSPHPLSGRRLTAKQIDSLYKQGVRDFSGIIATKETFSNLNLKNSIFDSAKLNDSTFTKCNLSHCSFIGAQLTQTQLTSNNKTHKIDMAHTPADEFTKLDSKLATRSVIKDEYCKRIELLLPKFRREELLNDTDGLKNHYIQIIEAFAKSRAKDGKTTANSNSLFTSNENRTRNEATKILSDTHSKNAAELYKAFSEIVAEPHTQRLTDSILKKHNRCLCRMNELEYLVQDALNVSTPVSEYAA